MTFEKHYIKKAFPHYTDEMMDAYIQGFNERERLEKMHDYIIQRAEHLLNKLEEDIDKKYLLGALTELQVMAITFHEWEASDFLESIINNNIRGAFFK